jgi:hypothetical protein
MIVILLQLLKQRKHSPGRLARVTDRNIIWDGEGGIKTGFVGTGLLWSEAACFSVESNSETDGLISWAVTLYPGVLNYFLVSYFLFLIFTVAMYITIQYDWTSKLTCLLLP